MIRLSLLAAVAAALAVAAPAAGRTYSFVRIASGLDNPVYVTSAPGDPSTLYVVEQPGTIEIVRGGAVTGTFLDLRDRVKFDGELGLLSLAFDPGYAQNHLFYVDYTDQNGDTHVVQFSSANGVGVPSSAHELLFVKQPYPNHKGGQLQFDAQGYLYVGMGDGGTDPAAGDVSTGDPQNHAQDPGSPLGKLLRIKPNLPGATWQTVGMGLRNPWRFSFDRQTGNLWIGDVGAGPLRGDRLPPEGEDRRRSRTTAGAASRAPPSTTRRSRSRARACSSRRCGRTRTSALSARSSAATSTAAGACPRRAAATSSATTARAGSGRSRSGPRDVRLAVTLLGTVPVLSSFGEDANGELYAVTSRRRAVRTPLALRTWRPPLGRECTSPGPCRRA